MTTFRTLAAQGVIKHCRRRGVVLIVNGAGVHAVPTGSLQRLPNLLNLVKRYRREIMGELNALVE